MVRWLQWAGRIYRNCCSALLGFGRGARHDGGRIRAVGFDLRIRLSHNLQFGEDFLHICDGLNSVSALLADIVVLDTDILTCPEGAIADTQIVYTIVGGAVMYEAGEAKR